MKLKLLAFALACGILWAFGMLIITLYPYMSGATFGMHGQSMKFMMMDWYPFYHYGVWYREAAGVLIGFVDGFVGGLIFAWLYNLLVDKVKK